MLAAQERYGRHRAQWNGDAISLGRNLYPTLPEDRFDVAVLTRGNFRMVADVRLDNRPELEAALGLTSSDSVRHSDSAVLFECLLRWGEEAPSRLIGEFAFALWDGDRRRMFLARDYIGSRPLYYHRGKNFLAIASMPSGLHALSQIRYDFDPAVMVADLAGLPRVGRSTFFRDIERIEPASSLIITRDGLRSSYFWTPPRPAQASKTAEQYAEGLRDVLDKAVAAQLRGAGDIVGTHLSAGMDSGVVTTSAALLFPEGRVIAFTSVPRKGFDGPVPFNGFYDEGQIAASTARKYSNVEHVLIPRGPESPLDELDRDFYFYQQPTLNLCNAVWIRAINRAAQERKIGVMLIGSGGNISITYDGLEQLPDLLARGRLIKLMATTRALVTRGMRLRALTGRIIGPFIPKRWWSAYMRLRGRDENLALQSAVNSEALGRLVGSPEYAAHDFTWRPSRRSTHMRYLVIARSDGGNYFKGVLAQYGISMRDPTADRRVMDYCFETPVEQFLHGGTTRSLGRRAFGSRLCAESIGKGRAGYQSADWYEALDKNRTQIDDELGAIARCAEAGDALDNDWLKQAVKQWPKGNWADESVVRRYRSGLLRGIAAGYFMRKVKGTN